MYIGLCSLLEQVDEDLTDKRIGLFSYGSGSVSEFFTAKVVPGYQSALNTERHAELLKARTELSYEEYLTLYHYPDPRDGEHHEIEPDTQGHYRLAAISGHKREYVER